MRVWILQIGEPIVGVDPGVRPLRCNMLGAALLARGHRVRWWASTYNHFTKSYRYRGDTTVSLAPGFDVTLLHATPSYRRHASLSRLLNQRSVATRFRRQCAPAERPDIIFACLPTPELCEAAIDYGLSHGVPVIIDARDMWPDLYTRVFPESLRPLGRLALWPEFRRVRKIFRHATGITAVSNAYLQWALAYASRPQSRRDAVFPLGYPRDPGLAREGERSAFLNRHGLRNDAKLVCFIGTLGQTYDLDTLVEAARNLHQEGRNDIQFVIAGKGDRESALKKRAAGVSNLVFVGWLDQDELRLLIHLSTVGLCAYVKDAPQSLPNKPFEYMSAGIPQISSLTGELEELIRRHGIGLPYEAGDARSLARQVKELVDLPGKRAEMSARARALFDQNFEADLIYGRLSDYLEGLASRESSHAGVDS